MKNYGETIKQMRKMQQLSVADIAEKTGLSRDTIYKAERGERGLTIRSAQKIADALKIPVAIFFER